MTNVVITIGVASIDANPVRVADVIEAVVKALSDGLEAEVVTVLGTAQNEAPGEPADFDFLDSVSVDTWHGTAQERFDALMPGHVQLLLKDIIEKAAMKLVTHADMGIPDEPSVALNEVMGQDAGGKDIFAGDTVNHAVKPLTGGVVLPIKSTYKDEPAVAVNWNGTGMICRLSRLKKALAN